MATRVRNWRAIRWIVLGTLGVIGLALGIYGFLTYVPPKGTAWPSGFEEYPEAVYRTLQLVRLGGSPVGQMNTSLEIARLLLPLVAAYSVLTAFFIIFWDRAQQLRLPFWRGHTIVIGLGGKGTAFVKSLRDQGQRVVAIERDPSSAGIPTARALRAPVVDGDGRDPAVLLTAGIQRARAVIAVTGDDSVNAEAALAAVSLPRREQSRALRCLAHIDSADLALLLETGEFRRGAKLDYFTVDAHAARILVSRYVLPSNGEALVAVVGSGPLVEQFLDCLDREHAAQGVAPNRVALVADDEDGLEAARQLCFRLPHVPAVEVVDCTTESITDWAARALEPGALVLVDRADDGSTLETALALRHPAAALGARVVACLRRSPGLERALSGASGEDLEALQAYSVITSTCTADLLDRSVLEQIAQAIHEDYVAHGHHRPDDPAMLPWLELDESYRESNRAQAATMVDKLESIDCDISTLRQPPFEFEPAEVEQLARAEHDRWSEERTRDGWTYGDVRDLTAKTHPSLRPFDELSQDEQDKDRDAVRGIPLQLARAGIYVVRSPARGEPPHESADATPEIEHAAKLPTGPV